MKAAAAIVRDEEVRIKKCIKNRRDKERKALMKKPTSTAHDVAVDPGPSVAAWEGPSTRTARALVEEGINIHVFPWSANPHYKPPSIASSRSGVPSTDAESSPTTPADARQQQSMGAESSDSNSSEPIGLYRYATMTVSHAQATISERFINSTRSVSEPVHVDNVDSSSVLPELGAAFGRLSLVQDTTDTTVA